MLTAVPTTEPDPHGPVRPAVKPGENGGPHVGRVVGRTVSGIRVAARYSPCRPNDENSRGKVQNVCGDSFAHSAGSSYNCAAAGGIPADANGQERDSSSK